ncbi:hypothetical protein LSH36_41g03014 [Paralvinella palmiformis]|uniref:Uncharacterized protein n=1 Tax=Paralvinella palmiformis TaxID=53620 RepID=A0AAD9K804_9ANNE|nr:hypothetical protein LSH36_41g03014 [Paralvinella palmiformis]
MSDRRQDSLPICPTVVICDLFINSFDSVSVDQMDYSMNIYSRQSWMDPRLSYDEDYPEIKDFKDVLCRFRYSLTLTCHMTLEYFPHDKQKCDVILESYGYTLSEIQFRWREPNPIQVNDDLELPQFEMTGYETGKCNKSYITGNFSCLRASFFLRRKYGYYMIQNYIPAMLIVILSWVSFWINIDAVPARISLGVLTVLTMTTQSVGAWMSLPRASYVKAIDIWISTCVFFVFAAMLEFALVNTLARKEIRRMSLKIRGDGNNHDINTDIFKRMLDEYTYGRPEQLDPSSRNLARRVDKVSRWLFPCIFVIFCVVYWCVFYLTDKQ